MREVKISLDLLLPSAQSRKNETPKLVDIYLTAKLKKKIDGCEWLSDALPFAYRPVSSAEETDYLGQAVYERLQRTLYSERGQVF
ncbi:MAG TPA: hypothetical protein VKX39_17565 [Bryobacteraceae bacterium]|jgi:hypothetical protein|nr:hypothetical protein [Bryobacteraceae bacterium]